MDYEIKITSSNLETLNAILYFSIQFIENEQNINKMDFGTNIKDKEIIFKLGVGMYKINYQKNNFIINYVIDKTHPPLDCNPEYIYYSELIIKSNSLENIQNYIKESIKYYKNEILKEKFLSDKINIYSLTNGNWFIFNKINKRLISTIYLPDNLAIKILNNLKNFLSENTVEKYNKLGIMYKKNLLFEGPPGTGKTSLIISLASELDLNIYFLSFDKKLNDSNFLQIVRNIKENSILVIEDSDVLFNDKKNILSLMSMLNVMDGIASKNGLITIITTNKIESLEQSVKRASRIDNIYHFDYMKEAVILEMINNLSNNIEFKEFLEKIKNIKITPAELQQYLLKYEDNLIDNVDELIQNKLENNLLLYS